MTPVNSSPVFAKEGSAKVQNVVIEQNDAGHTEARRVTPVSENPSDPNLLESIRRRGLCNAGLLDNGERGFTSEAIKSRYSLGQAQRRVLQIPERPRAIHPEPWLESNAECS